MTEADVIQPSASTASTSTTSFRYIGDYVYILTGVQNVDNNVTNIFEGTNGSGLIVAKWQPVYFSTSSTDNAVYKIYFNDILIYTSVVTDTSQYTPYEEVELILPPFTKLKVESYNRTDSSTLEVGIILTDRVYGAT